MPAGGASNECSQGPVVPFEVQRVYETDAVRGQLLFVRFGQVLLAEAGVEIDDAEEPQEFGQHVLSEGGPRAKDRLDLLLCRAGGQRGSQGREPLAPARRPGWALRGWGCRRVAACRLSCWANMPLSRAFKSAMCFGISCVAQRR